MTLPATMDTKKILLVINCFIFAIGHCGGPLIMRLYFLNGGKRIWLSSWLETGGWPITFIPLTISYLHRRSSAESSKHKLFFMKPRLLIFATVVGVLTGFDDYIYAYGVARLPVSTTALIIASQLAFTAIFAFFLVKQKFTPFSINAVVLLTGGAGVLALHTKSDLPEGESRRQYVIGFVMTVAAALLYALVLPLVELSYKKSKQIVTYTIVLEFNLVICFFATLICTIGMAANHDFQVIPREAKEFRLGETKYYVIMALSAIIWQCFFIGATGIIFCSSSLFSGIMIAVLLPVTEVLAVLFYHENFQAEKGVALALSLWGFVSYSYGEMNQTKMQKQATRTEMASQNSMPA